MPTVTLHGDPAPPRSLSPTSASTWQQCGLKHALAYLYGWQESSTAPQLIGNATHKAVELLYGLDPAERTRGAASELLRSALTIELSDDTYSAVRAVSAVSAVSRLEQRAMEACEGALDGLFALEDPRAVTVGPDGLEIWVEADLYGAPVRGRIDRLYDASGAYVIADYKTGRTPAPAYTAKAFFGLWTYAAALAASGEGLPDRVELLYLVGRERLARPVIRTVAIEQARALATIWREIVAAHDRRRAPARTSRLCDWCAFQPACPAQAAGVPPVGSAEHDRVLADLGLRRRTRPPERGVPDVLDVGEPS